MTQKATPKAKPKAPDLIAWNIVAHNDRSFWNRVGAAWRHGDGNGFSLILEQIPVDGRIVLRPPMADTKVRGA